MYSPTTLALALALALPVDQQAHPVEPADLEAGRHQTSSCPELVDYHLGEIQIGQDFVARNLVLLTTGSLHLYRIRAASLPELNRGVLDALSKCDGGRVSPLRESMPRVKIPKALAPRAHLIRMMARGFSEQVGDVRIHPPAAGPSVVALTLSYRAQGVRRRLEAGGARLEDVLMELLARLFPGPGGL